MSLGTITHRGTETLVMHRCWCGLLHAIPAALSREAENNGHGIHCPVGHEWFIGETEVKRLKKKLEEEARRLCLERSRHDQTRAELKFTENQRRGEKAAKTRIVNRVARGVCPCCNRSFTNLKRHMTTKHPGYAQEEITP